MTVRARRAQIGLTLGSALLVATAALFGDSSAVSASSATPIAISQTPLTVVIPAHPQIVIALGNSQSMDGDLSGAIMTGSGSLGGAVGSGLAASSSPVDYTIPAGFTPPANPGSGGSAPYTVSSGGNLIDNSASRLNVAKAGISAILNSYMQYADFALMDYSTGSPSPYTTWVYYMSPAGSGFTFTGSPGTSRYVPNPCYNASTSGTDAYSTSCAKLESYYGSSAISEPDMLVGSSSDDPSINDVLYAGGLAPVCMTYGGPTPSDPFPPNYSLGTYNTGGVYESYSSEVGSCARTTGPTNAGYVPYSPQVMYAERGFGFYTSQSATTGHTVVPMTSAGQTPTPSTVATAISAFTPYLQPETNSSDSTEIKALAVQSPVAGLLAGADKYFVNSNPSSSNGCSATRYVVLVTDGLPTEDMSGHSWPPLGSNSASGYGVTASFNADGSLASTNDQALTDTITELQALKSAGIKTYVIGLGAGVETSNNPLAASTLTAMAIAGGTGSYFPATSPSDLTGDMQVILSKILATTQAIASATVNAAVLNTTSAAYLPQFTTSDKNQDWTGNLTDYPINPTTGQVNTTSPVWSARTVLDGQNWDTGRLIATWDPVAKAGIPFRWSNGNPSSGIAASTTLGQELETNTADPSGQDALDYLRGDRGLEAANGGPYRTRTYVLGDIVDSSPLYVGAAQGPYQSVSYFNFEQTYANREPVLYVGANDGMLHAFNAQTGKELFAFIPNGVFPNLIKLTNPYYNEQHQFYVDGPPQAGDVQFSDGTWHTVLVGGEGAGGQSVYALDITDPASITTEADLASKVLWEFTDPDMGDSYSVPVLTDTAAGFMTFFGNGYDSPSQKPVLYALDPQTGAVRAKIDLCAAVPSACNSAVSNGLSSVTVTNAGTSGTPATVLYAGDLQGNVWRVDLTNSNPANWTVSVLFQARDPSGNPQPITTAPAVTLNPDYPRLSGNMVYVGTGQMLGVQDLSSTQVQTLYGIYDSGTTTSILTRSDLEQEVMQTDPSNSNLRVLSSSATKVALPTQKGWYVDFDLLTGERLITDPLINSGAVIVTSNQPSPNLCTGGNVAYLNEFNFAGGQFTSSQFDTNGSGSPNSGDAVGLYLGDVYAATPTITHCPGCGGTGTDSTKSAKLITESNSSTKTVIEKGSAEERTAWREIR